MKQFMLFILITLLIQDVWSQQYKLIESDNEGIILEINFKNIYTLTEETVNGQKLTKITGVDMPARIPGDPWLPYFSVNIGIPHNSKPLLTYSIIESESYSQKLIYPYQDIVNPEDNFNDLYFNSELYSRSINFPEQPSEISTTFIYRYSRIATLLINPFQFNPVERTLKFNSRIRVSIKYNEKAISGEEYIPVSDKTTEEFIRRSILNKEFALSHIAKKFETVQKPSSEDDYWYNPRHKYLKLYVRDKDVYRVTYDDIKSKMLNDTTNLRISKIKIYSSGLEIPVDVVDDGDSLFNGTDYLQFVGYPPPASENSKLNIYTSNNIYWLTFSGEIDGLRYVKKSGNRTDFTRTLKHTQATVRFEKDTLFERMGYAVDGNRDQWYWGKVNGSSGVKGKIFEGHFDAFRNMSSDNHSMTLRVNLHGITSLNCNPDHRADIYITDQYLGLANWDGQNAITVERNFSNTADSIKIYPTGNILQVSTDGRVCNGFFSDEYRVNWFEFDYWRFNRADTNRYFFTSPANVNGIIRYQIWQFFRDSAKVYIPQKNEMIDRLTVWNDIYGTIFFSDSTYNKTEYYCFARDYYKKPDSISVNHNSDLRNITNGADYIIIKHHSFSDAAQNLANFRKNNLSNFPNARVAVVDVQDIYNEFNGGLLSASAIQNFLKYTFEEWTSPAPTYAALLGDMSWDYRRIISTSRPNFIPSLMYHSTRYGFAVSDNNLAAVAGDDYIPDIAIGRISCETPTEANTLVSKILNYPGVTDKDWIQNILLIGAGQDNEDESTFGFNDECVYLENTYINPNGYSASKVFRYPNKPAHMQYQGDRIEIREEFDKGAVIANFYGHGGGYQWDLVFNTDDIYALRNSNKLPFISSVTCYTAHFDNQDVFGEVFNKIPGKGSIGFWGSTGLTFWGEGLDANKSLFKQLFDEGNYVMGDALIASKINFLGGLPTKIKNDNIALFSYLGDPGLTLALPDKPDFSISRQEISITPENILLGDSVYVQAKIRNLGRIFPGDTAIVKFTASTSDTSFMIASKRLSSFVSIDSIGFFWKPGIDGIINIAVEVNKDNPIPEMDTSDNSASFEMSVFDLSEPNVIRPNDGFFTNLRSIDFLLADIGYYAGLNLEYFFEVSSKADFATVIFSTDAIIADKGLVSWRISALSPGVYFWRTRLKDGEKYSDWTDTRSFTITNTSGFGYFAEGTQLDLFTKNNFFYSDSAKALILDTKIKPPKPMAERLIDTVTTLIRPNFKMTSMTTDGTYLYVANKSFFNGEKPSPIFKIGTGNGNVYGQVYDTIPNFSALIKHSIFYLNSRIYVSTGDPFLLKSINPVTGSTSDVFVPDGILDNGTGKVKRGTSYLATDGRYVYNLAFQDSNGLDHYVIRTFDPQNGWNRPRTDLITESISWGNEFSAFFVAGHYFFPFEYYSEGKMRRIDLNNGAYEDQWFTGNGIQGYHAWCYDIENDAVYASVALDGYIPAIHKFTGYYKQSSGYIYTGRIGPAANWGNLEYVINTQGYNGYAKTDVQGYDNQNRKWENLFEDVGSSTDISSIRTSDYQYIRAFFTFGDSTSGISDPASLSKLKVSYESLPEIILRDEDFSFAPDSIMQGFPIEMSLSVSNIGYAIADSVKLEYYLNNSDSVVFSKYLSIPASGSVISRDTITTDGLLFKNSVRTIASLKLPEFYNFNNLADNNFYVAKDSLDPVFNITIDGKEPINGELIRPNPEIFISLSDNSPLALDTADFFIHLNNKKISFAADSIIYDYTPYPNSKATLLWKPELESGIYDLTVFAKDASDNFFDSTEYRVNFIVDTENKVKDIYNYPNPFSDHTYFTFTLTGSTVPDEMNIKVYTIAGRLIRDIDVPVSELAIKYLNKIFWDGRDQDGDEVSNGVYFYKVNTSYKDKHYSELKKLAKVK
ncbi:MAG: hypothetical protein K9I71_00645 [Ignavibacteriales bacterium]|nr:hypothetical protein [Ignavibacteriales bacterium]MCF8314594.1 hypothetical protein [Ignavibacteriales bacterium]MCF8436369.1 hypothetical protein [Ignavibacteriales bacterium]